MAGSAGAAASAWKAFETTNAISTVDDSLLKFDHAAHMALLKAKPYKNEYASSFPATILTLLQCSLLQEGEAVCSCTFEDGVFCVVRSHSF